MKTTEGIDALIMKYSRMIVLMKTLYFGFLGGCVFSIIIFMLVRRS